MSNSAFVSPAAANSSVGQTRFSGTRGHVGIVSFAREPAAARGGIPKWLPFVAAALALPLGLAVAVSANAPPLSSAAVTYLPPAISTLAAMVVYYWATLQVSFARRRFGVQPPATTGVSIDFDRYLRVQYNMLEGLALFLPTLWISAVYASPSAAAAAGAVWTLGRILYANGYYKETKARGPGFGVATVGQLYLLFSSGISLVMAAWPL